MNINSILVGLAFLVVIYEIVSGEIISRRRYRTRSISRKLEPSKFWLNIVIHLVIVSVLMAYTLGYLGG